LIIEIERALLQIVGFLFELLETNFVLGYTKKIRHHYRFDRVDFTIQRINLLIVGFIFFDQRGHIYNDHRFGSLIFFIVILKSYCWITVTICILMLMVMVVFVSVLVEFVLEILQIEQGRL
jgi:hypothetical protein